MIATIDIETNSFNSLLSEVTTIYCIGVKCDDDEPIIFTQDNYNQALELINKSSLVIGHNIIKFDLPIIRRLGEIKPRVVDTLIDSKLTYPKDLLSLWDKELGLPTNLIGSYSLRAFGYRLKSPKLEFDDFTCYSPKMATYCKADIELTYKLYKKLLESPYYPSKEVRELEYEVARIISAQEENGFYFDIDKARELSTKLKFRQLDLEHKLKKIFPAKFEACSHVLNSSKRVTKTYYYKQKDSLINLRPFRIGLSISMQGKFKKFKSKFHLKPFKIVTTHTEGLHQRIKLVSLNPSSRVQLIKRLKDKFNFTPKTFTLKGTPKLGVYDDT